MTVSRSLVLLVLAGGGLAPLRATPTPLPRSAATAEYSRVSQGAGPGGVPIGMTLFPSPVHAGDTVRYLVTGSILTRPSVEAEVAARFARGETSVAAGEVASEGQRWIAVRDGFVPAALVDRIPVPVNGILAAGHEGLVAGRVLPWNYAPTDLDTVPGRLVHGGAGRVIMLRRPALTAFVEMVAAARSAGVNLRVVSGFRSASYQATLFARQVERRGPFQDVSAPPGRSEHQLGTTVDVTAPGAETLETSFGETAAGRWLADNSERWGFVVSFSRDRHRARRVSYEPWHIRWVDSNTDDESVW